jgi:hypothetical protein
VDHLERALDRGSRLNERPIGTDNGKAAPRQARPFDFFGYGPPRATSGAEAALRLRKAKK